MRLPAHPPLLLLRAAGFISCAMLRIERVSCGRRLLDCAAKAAYPTYRSAGLLGHHLNRNRADRIAHCITRPTQTALPIRRAVFLFSTQRPQERTAKAADLLRPQKLRVLLAGMMPIDAEFARSHDRAYNVVVLSSRFLSRGIRRP